MNLKEAYTVLGIPPTSTPEEAKKQYRKLSKEHHPDVSKDPEAEAKFKKINEAYETIKRGKDPEPTVAWNPFNPFGNTNRQYFASHVDIQTTISFKDAVQGCKSDIKYVRQTKCGACNGAGHKTTNNGCKTCGGRGQVVRQTSQKGVSSVHIMPCPDCRGRTNTVSCQDCSGNGTLEAEVSITVSIPAAVSNGNVLRLQGMGHYNSSLMGMVDTYTDALLHIHVVPDPHLRLEGKDVVSDLHLSLLEALQGCTTLERTIDGARQVSVPPLIKNKEEVVIQVGDQQNIKQRIIVHVKYPTDINKLIDVLSEKD